jgi:hypothetical protein
VPRPEGPPERVHFCVIVRCVRRALVPIQGTLLFSSPTQGIGRRALSPGLCSYGPLGHQEAVEGWWSPGGV